ncbi:MAG: hemin uptake protein HemP [Burkholderiales bacterium]
MGHRQHATPPRRLTSAELLGDRCEVIIEHAGRDYRLRLTKNGRLILTA